MNRKSFGSLFGLILLLLPLLSACSDNIPGEPRKIVEAYIHAVQKSDFKTIYSLSSKTARRKQYLEKLVGGDVKKVLRDDYEKNLADYKARTVTFTQGIQWTEKHFFPSTSTVKIGKAHNPKPIEGDPVNADYLKGFVAIIPVDVEYHDMATAPLYSKQRLKSASYKCTTTKMRGEESVRSYDVDIDWYFAGCIIDHQSAKFYKEK